MFLGCFETCCTDVFGSDIGKPTKESVFSVFSMACLQVCKCVCTCVFSPGLGLQGEDFPNIVETHIGLEQNKYEQRGLKPPSFWYFQYVPIYNPKSITQSISRWKKRRTSFSLSVITANVFTNQFKLNCWTNYGCVTTGFLSIVPYWSAVHQSKSVYASDGAAHSDQDMM